VFGKKRERKFKHIVKWTPEGIVNEASCQGVWRLKNIEISMYHGKKQNMNRKF